MILVMNCQSVVSPLQFDVSPKPLLVRKETYVEREEYDIHYDHNNDCITVTKTELLVRRQTTTSSESSSNHSTLPHNWQTIRQIYFNTEDPDLIQESPDEGVYEEVTHNSTSVEDRDEKGDENQVLNQILIQIKIR